jgi:hypothetical protein
MANCYENIIGLTPENVACLPEVPTVETTSNSGLYITDIKPVDSLIGIDDLYDTEGTVFTLLGKARSYAINSFIAETNALISKSVRMRQQAYLGKIGEPTAKDKVAASAFGWQGIHILCSSMFGATFTLKSIELIFEATGTKNVYLADKYNNVLMTATGVVLANGKGTIQANLTLPCYDNNGYAEYWIYYDNTANKAFANGINCGCTGFTPSFSKSSQHFGMGFTKGNGWANWLMIEGVQFSALNHFDSFDDYSAYGTQARTNNVMNGIILDVSVGCSIESIMCDQVKDFYMNPFAMSIAKAIQLKSADLFTTSILSSAKISRATMINSEEMARARAEWRAEYLDILNYITQNVQIADQSDCFSCRPMIEMNVKPILS